MHTLDEHNDTLLFQQIAEGNEQAYTRIFHLYTPKLFPYLLKITKDEQIAREFVQETFLRLWVNRSTLKNIELPASWLFRIAANLSLEYLRSQALRSRLQEKVESKMKPGTYMPDEMAESRDFSLIVHKAIAALPIKRKEVYLLSREEGLSHKEIAEKMNISVNTVKNHLGMALKSIYDFLQQHTGLSLSILFIILGF